ncbi:MAG: penicillin-binding protein [Actinomycetota bacterium]|nr:penicillin-binding protein [Actinomycetota bacterium]
MSRSSPRRSRTFAALAAVLILAPACQLASDLDEEIGSAPPLAQTSRIYDSRGNLITTLHAEEDRQLIRLEKIPELLQDAVVAIEDQRFWTHRGVDLKAIIRAAYVNTTTGEISEGASTITQQYVRNAFSEIGTERTLQRKVREASLAWQIEKEHSKEWILEQYLNTVYFGEGAYGIRRGAKTFFNKLPERLTLPESALLAGLIAGPARWDPLDRPFAALERRNLVLQRMYDLEMISESQLEMARSQPLGLRPNIELQEYPAPYFVDYVRHEILTDERWGESYRERYNFLFKGGLRIYTTIDLRMQRAAENAVNGILSQPTDPYGALTAVDPRTGAILSMVGGRHYWARRSEDRYAKVNLATGGSTGRQAGSSFKPFALVAALENGIPPNKTYPAPGSIVLDEPPCGSEDFPWNVENYEGSSYGGALSVEQATISSVNVVFAQIIRDVHPARVVEVAKRMGIRSRLRPFCSSVLGTNEVNTMEMASAFGTLSAGGVRHPPYAIERIEDSSGDVIYQADPEGRQAIEPLVAWTATQILRKVILSGTGTAANFGRPAAGKTGTAQEWRDAWFAGYIPQVSAAVWVGFPQGQIPMVYPRVRISRVTGGSFPAQIWHAFMTAATQNMPVRDFKEPEEDFVTIPIDITKGCVATSSTPSEDIRYIQFVPGTEPEDACVYDSYDEYVTGAEVPDVLGMSVGTAQGILQEAGFLVDLSYEVDPGYANGTVIEQDPEPGANVEDGATVTIVASTKG